VILRHTMGAASISARLSIVFTLAPRFVDFQ
jgi:hypothetical protein